jgi:FkbM family methyltransferase
MGRSGPVNADRHTRKGWEDLPEEKLVEVADGVRVVSCSALDARFLYREIFAAGTYGDLDLPAGAFVIDVGANIGMFLLYIKSRFPDASMLGFEPFADLAAAARRNVELAGHTDVRVLELAVSRSAERQVPFTYYPLMPSGSTRHPGQQERLKAVLRGKFPPRLVDRIYQGRQVPVDVEPLSAFLTPDRPVDLLKIDAVGSELDVLAGIEAEHWPLIRRVVVDVQNVGRRLAAVRARLTAAGMATWVRPAPLAGGDDLNFLVHGSRP